MVRKPRDEQEKTITIPQLVRHREGMESVSPGARAAQWELRPSCQWCPPQSRGWGGNSLDSLLLSSEFFSMPPTGRGHWARAPRWYILQHWVSEAQSNRTRGKDGSEGQLGIAWPTNSGSGPDEEGETTQWKNPEEGVDASKGKPWKTV